MACAGAENLALLSTCYLMATKFVFFLVGLWAPASFRNCTFCLRCSSLPGERSSSLWSVTLPHQPVLQETVTPVPTGQSWRELGPVQPSLVPRHPRLGLCGERVGSENSMLQCSMYNVILNVYFRYRGLKGNTSNYHQLASLIGLLVIFVFLFSNFLHVVNAEFS